MTRAEERAAILVEKARLKAKYPPDVYARLTLEPEDLLAYVRRVIRFGEKARSEAEMTELYWRNP